MHGKEERRTQACVALYQAPKSLDSWARTVKKNSMKASRMTILALSMPFYFLIQTGKGAAEVDPAGTVKFRKNLQPSHRDIEVEERKQPSIRLWKAAEGEAQLGDGEYDKAASNLQLGTSKQRPSGKRPFLPLSPPKSKGHLEGHGSFNTDTYSCSGIQLKACRKPSDCGGCLGLYTCKLPKGKCDFKAVSRQTGGFLRNIQERLNIRSQ